MGYGNQSLSDMAHDVARVNIDNGWYEERRPFGDDVALLHSEISEMYEGYRKDDMQNVAEELADIFIRVLDTAYRYNINLQQEYQKKLEYNKQRGYRHGDKVV